ncbi:MAG: hypothetical protein BV456_04875 [Thermoplasmata archaeon M8B2D]|nr:MAG: hypothetical protein BV456_04875 [Thermoplasmata archaeon M8B2D]
MNKKIISVCICLIFIISIAFSIAVGKQYSIVKKISDDKIIDNLINPNEYRRINCNLIQSSTDTYLINTVWGQWWPYNAKCPMNNEPGRPPFQERLGCWSVAIGQIINHHHEYYDLQTQGINNYLCTLTWIDPQHIINNLDDHDYDWSQMVDVLTSSSSYEAKDNVSRLLYDCATIIQKDFGTGGYKTIETTDDLTDLINELIEHYPAVTAFTEWDNDLNESEIVYEIDYGRPIMFYTIGHDLSNGDSYGHAWIIDGYRYVESGGRLKFEVHFNYGWAGDNPDPLVDSWYYYYGNFPSYDPNIIFDEPSIRKGLLIRLVPTPPTLYGPSTGIAGQPYDYTASSVYDVNPPLYYKFDWGDGTFSDWLGRYDSGEPCTTSHKWKEKGSYEIKAKAKDVNGWESKWSEPLSISMPKTKPYLKTPLLLRFVENHATSNDQLSTAAFVKIKGVNGESKISAGFILTIKNLGDQILRDIEWTFDTEGGTVIFGDGIRGTIPVLNESEEINIIFRPGNFILKNADGQSPIGIGRVTLMATAQTSTDIAETTEDIFLIGPIILFQ